MVSRTTRKGLLASSLAAIGIIYGDLGTSPLYAFRESLRGLPITPGNIYGVLSLIFWSLMLIISIKYIIFVLCADNEGEGGVLALLALIKKCNKRAFHALFGIAIFGTALLISDGMITPAISVVSAVEGLNVISPEFSHLTLPITLAILFVLYFCQRFGTAKIAHYFFPILFTWFIVIAILGGVQALKYSHIFSAINPYYGAVFFIENGWKGYAILGAVFLVLTGGEALYADLGQFGKSPIRVSWFFVVLPSLLLNYFGQGAYLLKHPEAIENPFYALSPAFFSYPLLILATLATITASQAVISATFSLAKQAVLLDLLPKIPIIQTSSEEKGQVYVPSVNLFLAAGTISFVFYFKNSNAMAYAYGIAVNLVMLSVTLLLIFVAYTRWHWSIVKIVLFFSIVFLIEMGFLGANLQKVLSGGWLPLLFAVLCGTIMATWYKGLTYLRKGHYRRRGDIKDHLIQHPASSFHILPNALAIIITDPYDKSGGCFLRHITFNQIMAKTNLILSITIENYPYINEKEKYECVELGENIYRLVLHVGFMQLINIPNELAKASRMNIIPFPFKKDKATYFIENTNISLGKQETPFSFWQKKLFSYLMRNATLGIEFYHLPPHQSISIGSYCEL